MQKNNPYRTNQYKEPNFIKNSWKWTNKNTIQLLLIGMFLLFPNGETILHLYQIGPFAVFLEFTFLIMSWVYATILDNEYQGISY